MTIRSVVTVALVMALAAVAAAQSELQLPSPPGGASRVQEVLLSGNGQGFAGLAALDRDGQPVIYYDGVWMDRIGGVGSAGFRFTRAHEYAHHSRGHVVRQYTTPPALLPMLGYDSELEADCWAVRALAKRGDDDAVEAAYEIYRSVLPAHDSQGRPGAARRAANMDSCLGRTPAVQRTPAVHVGRSCQTQVVRCGPFTY